MDRVEALRAARNGVVAKFAEYLGLRSKAPIVLVFEGKECPSYYMVRIVQFFKSSNVRQVIAHGKKILLSLRDRIRSHPQTKDDKVLYFIDRDFDETPLPDQFSDIYVTNGYSIENNVVTWGVIQCYLRALFSIDDAADHDAMDRIESMLFEYWNSYLSSIRDVNFALYACRKLGVKCVCPDNLIALVKFNFPSLSVASRFSNLDDLLLLLQVPLADHASVKSYIASDRGFLQLDARLHWRGKFHLYFIRHFLISLREARVSGDYPFSIKAKPATDPAQLGLLGTLAPYVVGPKCLDDFLSRHFSLLP